MRFAICDDNPECLSEIQEHIKFFNLDTGTEFEVRAFSSGEELIESNLIFDLAVLDIEMDGMNGLKTGEFLRNKNPHIILIYLTSHKKYLDEALNLNAVRFFEKPIDSDRFYRGLQAALERIDNSVIKFALKDGKSTDIINAKDIIYVEIEHRHSKVVTSKTVYHSSEQISFWREKLQGACFAIPHRSYIVNLNFISTYQRNLIFMSDSIQIPISKSQQTAFHQKFCRFLEGK